MHDQHDQHDVHTVMMEHSKIIKNTVKNNPIIQEKINQVRCKAKFAAFKQKPWKSNRMEDVPVDTQRQMPKMQKVQNTKMVSPIEEFSGAGSSTRLSEIPVTVQRQVQMMQRMLKKQKGSPDTLCISSDPVHKRVPVQSEALREERVQTKRRFTMNSHEQHPKETDV